MAVQVVQMDKKTWRFEDGFVYYYLLVGEEKALLIDSGISGGDVRNMVLALTDLPVLLVNTHGDGDHTAANNCFGGFYVHPDDYYGKDLSYRFPDTPHTDVTDGYVFDLGGRRIEVISIPGHTPGSIALLDMNNRILFSGDTVQNSVIYMFGEKRCPQLFAKSLQHLIEISDSYDTVCASHGTPVLPGNYASLVLADWNDTLAGKIEGVKEEIFGNEVRTYHGKNCGFYLADK